MIDDMDAQELYDAELDPWSDPPEGELVCDDLGHIIPGRLERHPFRETPQWAQAYGEASGRNGLGVVFGGSFDDRDEGDPRSARPTSTPMTARHGARVGYDADAHRSVALTHSRYFGGTGDEHTTIGEKVPYSGPSEETIRRGWDWLTQKQQFVLGRLRGLNGDGHQYTHREIASVMGLSHVAVVGIEKRALRQLGARIAA